jgi:hypothetical protein
VAVSPSKEESEKENEIPEEKPKKKKGNSLIGITF